MKLFAEMQMHPCIANLINVSKCIFLNKPKIFMTFIFRYFLAFVVFSGMHLRDIIQACASGMKRHRSLIAFAIAIAALLDL